MKGFMLFLRKEFPQSCTYIPLIFFLGYLFRQGSMMVLAGIAMLGVGMNVLVMWVNGRKMPVRIISEGFRRAVRQRQGYCEMHPGTRFKWLADIILVEIQGVSNLYSIGDIAIIIGVFGWSLIFIFIATEMLRNLFP